MSVTESRTISNVATRTASDGSQYDVLRFVPEEIAKRRGEILIEMKKLAEAREPELLEYLQAGSGISAEYATSSGIAHAKDKAVKADLVRVHISGSLAEGDRWGVVRILDYADAQHLDLAEFDDPYITGLYDAEVQEGDHDEAWHIASMMADHRNRDKILNYPNADADFAADRAWKEREESSFQMYARDVLAQDELLEPGTNNWRLKMLFEEFRFREDGFQAEKPSELAEVVANRMVDREVQQGRDFPALMYAIDGKLPKEKIKELRAKVTPQGKAIKGVKEWFNGVRARVRVLTGMK